MDHRPAFLVPVSDEVGRAHRSLSRTSESFLAFVGEHPELLSRRTFGSLDRADDFRQFPVQSWPTFVDRRRLAEMDRVSTGLCRIIKSLPSRVLHNEAGRLASFYGLAMADAVAAVPLLESPEILRSVLGRGDFVLTRDGIKCLEFNLSGSLGGWCTTQWEPLYMDCPPLAQFIAAAPGVSCAHIAQRVFSHVAAEAVRSGLAGPGSGSSLNLVMAVPANEQGPRSWMRYADREWKRVLGGIGLTGEARICEYNDLLEWRGGIFVDGEPLHILVEHYDGQVTPAIYRSWLAGRLQVYGGPLVPVLSSKLNLCLMSELAESEAVLEPAERQLIRAHVPWSRSFVAGRTAYGGEEVALPDFVLAERQRLVLKPAAGAGGVGVEIGARTTEVQWSELVRMALAEGGWVVQELAESAPFLYQAGDHGCAPHDVIWGLFVFGDAFGGCYLRMMPKQSSGPGVINSKQGAKEGIVFEVDE